MLKRIKVVTSLIAVLVIFGALQLLSGSLFWSALNRAMLRLQTSMASQMNGGQLDDLMNKANAQLAEADRHFQVYYNLPGTAGMEVSLRDRLEADYARYDSGLKEMIKSLQARDLEEMFKQNIEQKQVAMQGSYGEWRARQTALAEQGIEQNQQAFSQMMWLLGVIAVSVLVVIVACWFGLRQVLIQPLQQLLAHIRAIASGDLTQPSFVEGRNEMSQLAAGIQEMQQSLVMTVSNVRDGSDAIFTGASEIAAGNNDLSARAGEQGRSFAVVAGKVRSLAQRSAQAAKEIKGLIEDSVSRVNTGSVPVESAGDTMSNIVSAVTRVTDIMGEIASASDEQSRGIDQVGLAVTEMDRVTQQNASLVEESAAAAALEDQASHLKQAVSVFNIGKEFVAQAVNKTTATKSFQLDAPLTVARQSASRGDDNWETF
ncbi:HAMP domain-containing protein [Pantoea sp. Eser]|nr:HAMP domain-containing protein [Pantoea sp. Eser]